MDNLVMPLALPGREIEADNGIAEQIISRTMAAIVISSWIFDGQVHEAEVFICRHLRPYPGVPVGRPRIVLPGIVPELAGARNRVEGPHQLARMDVVGAHRALGVIVRHRRMS